MFKSKETIIGYVLIVLLMGGLFFHQFTQKQKELELKKQQQKEEMARKAKEKAAAPAPASTATISTVDSTGKIITTDAATAVVANDSAMMQQYGSFANVMKGEEKLYVLETALQKLTLSSKGGQIKSIELKKYKTSEGKPLVLFTDKTNTFSYQFATDNNQVIDTKDLYFEPSDSNATANTHSMALRLNLGGGKYFEQVYALNDSSYLFDYNVNMVGMNTIVPSNTTAINVNWQNTLIPLEKNIELERRYSALYYRYSQNDVEHLSEDKNDDEVVPSAPLEWISYKQQFFNTTLFSKGGQMHSGKLKTHFGKEDLNYVKKYDAQFTIPFNGSDKVSYAFQYYIGPNHYKTLAALDREAESIIKLSPDFWLFSWIKYITKFIIWVFGWFNSTNLNYGIIILLMTIILKIVLHPLTAKSIESAAKMKILAPEIAALKEKYGDDQAKIGAEQMKLYQRAGVSPFGGCLPLLVQMPILMAMYYFFPASIELRQEHFLWATDLSSYDSIATFATALPLIGNHISLFTILMTITSVLQAVMNNQMNAMGNQQPGMKYMPYFMPVVLMFMFNSFPAALTYYYLLQNVLGIGHQWIIQRFFIDEAKLRHKIEENKKNPKAASSWQKKLEEMQRSAQQKAKQK